MIEIWFVETDDIRTTGKRERWGKKLIKKLSPRFGHCAVYLKEKRYGDDIWVADVSFAGRRIKEYLNWPYIEAPFVSVEMDLNRFELQQHFLTKKQPKHPVLSVLLGFIFPRKFDNCASWIGSYLGISARTPDKLYEGVMKLQDGRHHVE